MPDTPQTVEDRQAERLAEYSYVAVVDIDLEGGRAFNVGHLVPKGHVERGVVLPHQVAKTSTKAGQQAAAAATDETPKG